MLKIIYVIDEKLLKRTPRAIENVVNEPNTFEPSSFPITSRSHVSLYPHKSRKGPPVNILKVYEINTLAETSC